MKMLGVSLKKSQGVKTLIAGLLIMVMVTFACNQTASAADTIKNVTFNVTYGQTDARKMLSLINDFRTGSDAWVWNLDDTEKVTYSNLGTLAYDYELEQIAMQRAAEVAINWSHTRPNGESCFTVYSNGVRSYGENIAAGYSTYEAVFAGWQETNEPYYGQGHRRNMLDSDFTAVGIAHVVYNGTHYWVQEFGYTASGTTATAATDTEKSVNIPVKTSYVSSLTRASSVGIISVVKGKTTNVPAGEYNLVTTEVWPSGASRTITADSVWTVADTSVAAISDGVITGISVGQTTISTTVLGQEFTVTINVLSSECITHSYDDGTVTLEPTCTDAGIKTYVCTKCGNSYTESISALGHDWTGTLTVQSGYEPTCTKSGYGNRHCARTGCCWYISETIPATGHTEVVDTAAVAATCTTSGTTKGSHCSTCNAVISTATTIAALGHNYTPTYTWSSDNSTCTLKLTCSRDSSHTVSESMTVSSTVTTAATCSATGTRKYTATYTYDGTAYTTSKTATIAKDSANHTSVVTDAAVAATCTKKGKKAGKHCDDCGSVIKAQTTTSALGHDFSKKTVKASKLKSAATTSSPAVYYYSCSRCGKTGTKTFKYGSKLTANVAYKTYVQSYGWQSWKYNGDMSGTSGKSKRLEAIKIKLSDAPYSGNIVYTARVQSYGWQCDENNKSKWKKNGQVAGTVGKGKRLEAIRIALTGEMAKHYDVYYRVRAQGYGWLGWAKNGAAAGTAGLSKRLEGIQIVLVPKGSSAPKTTYKGITSAKTKAYIKK